MNAGFDLRIALMQAQANADRRGEKRYVWRHPLPHGPYWIERNEPKSLTCVHVVLPNPKKVPAPEEGL